MTDTVLGVLLLVGIIVPMVALGWATLQPSRRSVWSAIVGLSVLPVVFLVVALVVWVMGR